MTEVVFFASVQGQGDDRVRTVAERLRKRLPDIEVRVVDGSSSGPMMAKYRLKFGPAVVIDGRLEYVGIPRLSMLVDRILQVRSGRSNPRTAGEKPGEKAAVPSPAPAPPAPKAPGTP